MRFSIKRQKAKLGLDHRDTRTTLWRLTGAYVRTGKDELVREAEAQFSEAIRMQPNKHEFYHHLTPCLVHRGDLEAYREHCRRIAAQFAETTEPIVAERMAKDCATLPDSGVDLAILERWTERSMAAGEEHEIFPWILLAKGMVQYRQGRYAGASETMRKLLEINGGAPDRGVQAWMLLAMSRYQLGESDLARSALAEGLQLAGNLPILEKLNSEVWIDWVFAHALIVRRNLSFPRTRHRTICPSEEAFKTRRRLIIPANRQAE